MKQVFRACLVRLQQVFTYQPSGQQERGPEEDFLDNAATMTHYAKHEIRQFMSWTNGNAAYQESAQELLQRLESLATEVQNLKQDYQSRAPYRCAS